jgi:hypothetical protein
MGTRLRFVSFAAPCGEVLGSLQTPRQSRRWERVLDVSVFRKARCQASAMAVGRDARVLGYSSDEVFHYDADREWVQVSVSCRQSRHSYSC